MKVKKKIWIFLIFFAFVFEFYSDAETLSTWTEELEAAFQSGSLEKLQKFYSPNLYDSEKTEFKYKFSKEHVLFKNTKIFFLSKDAILVYVPTSAEFYSNETEDAYFDFIYRIYRISPAGREFRISDRCMEDFNPDFKQTKQTVEVNPHRNELAVNCNLKIHLKTNYLILKLAKEFRIKSLSVNDKKIEFRRIGYFMLVDVGAKGNIKVEISGKIKSPKDNNQFFSVSNKCFFLRPGGFAALPAPPPDNGRRVFFSKDETEFDTTLIYPEEFTLLHYGKVYQEEIVDGLKRTSFRMTESWYDGISFYAQEDWNVRVTKSGEAKLSFYFPEEQYSGTYNLADEVAEILKWMEQRFAAVPQQGTINFVVVDKFYSSGLLNDGHSIIGQNAKIIAEGGYIHEVCHLAPQPHVDGNLLWIKEGFTNYLAFDWIEKSDDHFCFWEDRKRKYLNYFNLYEEPLSKLNSTRMPTYWAAYQKGPWIYRMLESVIGEENFRKALIEFGKMKGVELKNSQEYFEIFEKISGMDLSWYEKQWLDWKENPVLNLQSQFETSLKGGLVRIRVSQEGKVFRLPLEVEIQTDGAKISKTFWLNSAEEEFVLRVAAKTVSIKYDPNSRLFAILKTGSKSFISSDKIYLPGKNQNFRFKSKQSQKITEYNFIRSDKSLSLIQHSEGNALQLKVSQCLSPMEFRTNNNLVYSIDSSSGKIIFPDEIHDIGEPVYPMEMAVMLFSFVDWSKCEDESYVFLRPGSKQCGIAYAKKLDNAEKGVSVLINLGDNRIELFLKNHIPIKYIVDGKDFFELIGVEQIY
jgi:hypothetical protein